MQILWAACRHLSSVTDICAKFVKALRDNIDTAILRANVEREAKQNFIGEDEGSQVVRQGVAELIDAATTTPIADTDYARVNAVRQAFSLTDSDLGNAAITLRKSRILKLLDEGKTDEVRTTFPGPLAPRLDEDEHGIWAFSNVNYLVIKHRTQYVGHSSGVSVRLMKGVYVHEGSYRGTPIQSEFLSVEDNGELAITSHNVYFIGTKSALKLPFKKLFPCNSIVPLSQKVAGDCAENRDI